MFQQIKLSILIPSIPSRFRRFQKLFEKINAQATNEVEILGLFDNKKRSIGHKRDALVQMSKGEYVCFCDDDDDVSEKKAKKPAKKDKEDKEDKKELKERFQKLANIIK